MQVLEQTLDSREVADMVEKEHKYLMRDIRRYIDQIIEGNEKYSTECKIEPSDFFLNSEYKDCTGRTLPCYRITKKGCEFIAHKLTGTKGAIFTARYLKGSTILYSLIFYENILTFCTRYNIFIARAKSEVIRCPRKQEDRQKKILEILI